MLMRRLLCLLAVMCNCAFAQSQPPAPGPSIGRENQQERTDNTDKHTNDEQRGTENAPVVVKVMPPDNAAAKEKEEAAREEQKTAIEHRNAIVNIVMAVSTVVIVFFTAGLFITGRRTSRQQLRAYLGISGFEFKCPNENNPDFRPDTIKSGDVFDDFVYVTMKNHGATPASDVHVWCAVERGPFLAKLPKDRNTTTRAQSQTVPTVESRATVSPGQTYSSRVWMSYPQWIGEAKRKEVTLHIYGAVMYNDIFLHEQTTWFCYIYEPWHEAGDRFIPYERGNKAT